MYLCNLYLYIIYAHAFHTILITCLPVMLLFFYKQQESDEAILLFTRVVFILTPLSNVSEYYTPLYKEYYILYILNKPWKPNISLNVYCHSFDCC